MDDLVKRLRELHPEEFGDAWDFAFACQQAMHEAADAIEQLTTDLERSKEWETFWEKEANEALKKFQTTVASMPRWIPVEERRAEFPCICCDANGNMPFIPQGIVTIKDDQGVWQIDARLADPNLHQNRLKPVLGYQNRITNWMPLPPAPKEEA